MKNTFKISALVLGMALGMLASSNYTYAQEYITTQNTELERAIVNARAAQEEANRIGTTRAKQLSNYIERMLKTAKANNNANPEELIRALDDATATTYLLLGKSQPQATAKVAQENMPVVMSEPVSAQVAVTEPTEAVVATLEEASAEPVTETPVQNKVATAGTTITVEVPAEQPKAEIAIATDEDDKVILATAKIDTDNTTVDDTTTPEAEVPNTGEVKNNLVGKIIAITVAAIVALGGAILIVKRIKKNA